MACELLRGRQPLNASLFAHLCANMLSPLLGKSLLILLELISISSSMWRHPKPPRLVSMVTSFLCFLLEVLYFTLIVVLNPLALIINRCFRGIATAPLTLNIGWTKSISKIAFQNIKNNPIYLVKMLTITKAKSPRNNILVFHKDYAKTICIQHQDIGKKSPETDYLNSSYFLSI